MKKIIFTLSFILALSNLQAKENKDFVLPSNVYKLSPSEVQTAEANALNGNIDALEKLGLYYTWYLQDELSTLKGEAILAMRADLGDAQAIKALAKMNKKDLSLKLEKYTETLKKENSVLSNYILEKFCESSVDENEILESEIDFIGLSKEEVKELIIKKDLDKTICKDDHFWQPFDDPRIIKSDKWGVNRREKETIKGLRIYVQCLFFNKEGKVYKQESYSLSR